LETLDDEGIADDTIVLFMSDNGGAAYSVGGADNVPLRGGKGEVFEGGIRAVSVVRWPGRIPGGEQLNDIMSVMDVLPTLAEAAGVEVRNEFPLDGRSLWSSIADGQSAPREDYLFFASETPNFGQFNLTIFNDEWKLIQEVEQDQLTTDVVTHLYRINDDPNEYDNLADEYPGVVADLATRIRDWRAIYPINGTRSKLMPPPGWRAPKDWATYPRPLDTLQDDAAPGTPPPGTIHFLDQNIGERGRLIYGCGTKWPVGDVCQQQERTKNE
ncbi:MAG: sulfatase-like hydrolase/transferase, partial [Gammaproteobacteria bacterium]|nr:sulfatase-like hydrolase/transferase [Gammaproteobacteria bacterium]